MTLIENIIAAWGWTGIEPAKVVGENDFGNLMIKDTQDRYWRLCPEELYCQIIANNRTELDKLTTDPEFVHDWYMQTLVDKAKTKLGELPDGRKYYLVIPATLGGKYEMSNIKTISLEELVNYSGDLAQQIENLPDGAQVQLKVVD